MGSETPIVSWWGRPSPFDPAKGVTPNACSREIARTAESHHRHSFVVRHFRPMRNAKRNRLPVPGSPASYRGRIGYEWLIHGPHRHRVQIVFVVVTVQHPPRDVAQHVIKTKRI